MSAATPAKKKAPKPKKPATHPKFADMIKAAVTSLKEKGGSSRQAILKYIKANYKVDDKILQRNLNLSLKKSVAKGTLKQVKGTGASGSFKLAEKAVKPKATKADKPKKPKAKKPKAKKPAGEKKAKKPKAKKPKSPKKAKAPKPKKAKTTPKKKPAAKPKAKKATKPKKAAAKK